MSNTALILLKILVLWPLVHVLSVALHELGHVLVGRMAGLQPSSFGVGHGSPIWWVRVRANLTFFVGRRSFLGGLTLSSLPYLDPSRWRVILMTSGGVIFNFLLMSLAAFGWLVLGLNHVVIHLFFWVNLFLVMTSAIPIELKANRAVPLNDAAIIRSLLSNKLNISVLQWMLRYEATKDLLQTIEDVCSQTEHAIAGSLSFLLLGDVERAQVCLEEVQGHRKEMPPVTEFRYLQVWVTLHCERKCFEEAHAALSELDSLGESMTEPVAPIYIALLRAALALEEQNLENARECLQFLQEEQEKHFRQLVADALHSLSVLLAMAEGKPSAVQQEEQSLRAALPKRILQGGEFLTWCKLARWYRGNERIEDAVRVYQSALEVFQDIYLECPPTYRKRLQLIHSTFLEEAGQVLQEQGKSEFVDAFLNSIQNPEVVRKQKQKVNNRSKSTEQRQWAYRLLLANFMIAVGMSAFLSDLWLRTIGVMFLFLSVIWIFDKILLLLLRFSKTMRGAGGGLVLWLSWVVTFMWIFQLIQRGPF